MVRIGFDVKQITISHLRKRLKLLKHAQEIYPVVELNVANLIKSKFGETSYNPLNIKQLLEETNLMLRQMMKDRGEI